MAGLGGDAFYYSPLVTAATAARGREGGGGDSTNDILLFFIPGNPGVVGYYEPFLSRLCSSLVAKYHHSGICVYGRSLSGFGAGAGGGAPAGLREQILFVEDALFAFVRGRRRSGAGAGGTGTKVVLIGHSMGAYILLELLRRHKARGSVADIDLVGGILLFPTIVDIAKSPLGLKYNRILHIPHFALLVGLLAKILVFFIPARMLCGIVAAVMGYPPHAARATADFLKAKGAVRGALYLAKNEMDTITEDKWGEEVWGPSNNEPGAVEPGRATNPAKLVFYFGQNDHWVSSQTRSAIISTRGGHDNKNNNNSNKSTTARAPPPPPVTMLIDGEGIPHSFCLWVGWKDHSEAVAEKVSGWVERIVGEKGLGLVTEERG